MTTDYSLSKRIRETRLFKSGGVTKLFLRKDNGDTSELLIPSGSGGGIQSVIAGTNVTVDDTDPLNPVVSASGGGGSSSGVPIYRKVPFSFDTPNLNTGVTIYTPAVDDILLDAWIEIDTPWNGTTPVGDIGMFLSPGQGWYSRTSAFGVGVDLTHADGEVLADHMLAQGNNGTANSDLYQGFSAINTISSSSGYRLIPAKIMVANPIKLVVSTTGDIGGADPGATQGSGALYLVTVTPV